MGTRQYVGARYVPTFANPIQWDNQRIYEPLTMVTYLNNTYTSKKPVPQGVDINNTEYWALSGNYNAQVEQYRQEVENIQKVVARAVNVKDFGAVGNANYYDKTTNQYYADAEFTTKPTSDVAAFESAISFASTNKIHKIYVPRGNYYLPNKSFTCSEDSYLFEGEPGSNLISENLASGAFITINSPTKTWAVFECPCVMKNITLLGTYYVNNKLITTVVGLHFNPGGWSQGRKIENVGISFFNIGLKASDFNETTIEHCCIRMCDNGVYFTEGGYNPVPGFIHKSEINLCARCIYAPNAGASTLRISESSVGGGSGVCYEGTVNSLIVANCASEFDFTCCCDNDGNANAPFVIKGGTVMFDGCSFLSSGGSNDFKKTLSNAPVYTANSPKFIIAEGSANENVSYGVFFNACTVKRGGFGDNSIAMLGKLTSGRVGASGNILDMYGYGTATGANNVIPKNDLSIISENITKDDAYHATSGAKITLNGYSGTIMFHLDPTTDTSVTFTFYHDSTKISDQYVGITASDEYTKHTAASIIPSGANKIEITINTPCEFDVDSCFIEID